MKQGVKALIVDDSKSTLIMLERMLGDLGVPEVAKAANGLQAVESFKGALSDGTPYSLVFLDIVMPMMDGQDALLRMRAMEREAGITRADQAVIIMVSSLSSPSAMINALLYGDSNDFLVKPLEPEDLREMLVKYDCL
jgi:two-component system chemotaxis response regulator CheY